MHTSVLSISLFVVRYVEKLDEAVFDMKRHAMGNVETMPLIVLSSLSTSLM